MIQCINFIIARFLIPVLILLKLALKFCFI